MKDIPFFTTENGVASLTLKEIPINSRAYIKILSSETPKVLLEDCVCFCRACGAESIFASGIDEHEEYSLSATLMLMQASGLPESKAALFPITEATVSKWRMIYNLRMNMVPNASIFTGADEKKLLVDGDCYFVHRNGELLGIGKASGDTIEAVASIVKGEGREVLLALASVLDGDTVKLVVAKENTSAVLLYEKLGFTMVQEVSRWYKIL